jgi:phosphatidylserine/phosphatidylglycerophosphate/cardiolipin synthase-like enzyme
MWARRLAGRAAMTIELKVYDNGDHTCLVWLPTSAEAIPNCLGFTIHRTLKPATGGAPQDTYLHGFVGFSDDDKLDPNAPWKHPLQRYMWWDYLVSPGDEVQYSIVPVVGPDKDHLTLSPADGSAQTPPMTITGQASAHISAYFNKGIVSAQWVSRALASVDKGAKLDALIAQTGNSLRNALSGMLRPQLLNLLDDVKKNDGEIYAALYELNDPELIPALVALGQKSHLILGNGAFNSKKPDENSALRTQLRGKVDLHDRLVGSGHFAHNKFVVACDASGKPQRVLSGSTNWTKTGLCTQANNGIIVDDPDLGAHFIDQWNLLKAAGNAYPATLMQANATSKSFNVDGGSITQWFAPTDKGEDLDYARKLINGAQEGILFLFFNPGAFEPDDDPERWTLLQNILARHQQGSPNYDADLYIHGVVNQEIPGLTTEGPEKPSKHAAGDPTNPSPVKLYDGGKTAPIPVPYESMVPKAIKDAFHDWASEVMNQGVHVHSKVIVIDPFGRNPVVITGSHNLGYKASTKNDDNMMIVEDNAPLAASYAANIIAIYQTYRWNTYVDAHAKDPQVWHGLVNTATWQDSYLKPDGDDLAEIKFWLGEGASAPAAGTPVAAPASGGTQVRAATASGPSPHAKTPSRSGPTAKKARAKKGKPKAARRSAKPTASKRKAVPAKRTPATSRRTTVKKAPAKTRRAPAKKAPPKSRMARMKSTRAAATRRASGKIASRKARRGR